MAYYPDFSEADPWKPRPSSWFVWSPESRQFQQDIGLRHRLEERARVERLNRDKASLADYAKGIAGFPERTLAGLTDIPGMLQSLKSGATLPSDVAEGKIGATSRDRRYTLNGREVVVPAGTIADFEDPDALAAQTGQEYTQRLMDLSGLAMTGGLAAPAKGAELGMGPRWYSQAKKIAEEKGPAIADPNQWRATLGPHTKTEELEPIEAWLAQQGQRKIPRQELVQRINDQTPQIEEVWKSFEHEFSPEEIESQARQMVRESEGDMDLNMAREEVLAQIKDQGAGNTKFSQYQLPGGKRYRELLLTLPPGEDLVAGRTLYNKMKGDGARKWEDLPQWEQKEWIYNAGSDPSVVYHSSHWDEPNVLAHARMNDRWLGEPSEDDLANYNQLRQQHAADLAKAEEKLNRLRAYALEAEKLSPNQWDDIKKQWHRAEGLVNRLREAAPQPPRGSQRVLFLEEIQSDWHQAGRKQGYRNADVKPEETTPGAVPDAPFKKTWPELMLKRMVQEAADEGYDAIAWTDGATQAERYDLSKHVDRIIYSPNSQELNGYRDNQRVIQETGVSPEKLEQYVGKEAADKLLNNPTAKTIDGNMIEGDDLKLGGQGMVGFYDTMLPRMANKLFGRWGAKVRTDILPGKVNNFTVNPTAGGGSYTLRRNERYGDIVGEYPTWEEATRAGDEFSMREGAKTIHVLPITPELRRQATSQGFALFSGGEKKIGAALLGAGEQPLALPYRQGLGEGKLKEGEYTDVRILRKYPQHHEFLTHDHIKAVSNYSDGLYDPINSYLYQKPGWSSLGPGEVWNLEKLDDMLAQSEIPTNLTVWRGVSRATMAVIEKWVANHLPDDLLRLPGFLSTSLTRRFAEGWKGGPYYKIVQPRGSRGMIMGDYSVAGSEAEVLLPRNYPLEYQGRDHRGIMMFRPIGEPQPRPYTGKTAFSGKAEIIGEPRGASGPLIGEYFGIPKDKLPGWWAGLKQEERDILIDAYSHHKPLDWKLAKGLGKPETKKDYGNLAEELSKHPENVNQAWDYLLENKNIHPEIMSKYSTITQIQKALDAGWQPKTVKPTAKESEPRPLDYEEEIGGYDLEGESQSVSVLKKQGKYQISDEGEWFGVFKDGAALAHFNTPELAQRYLDWVTDPKHSVSNHAQKASLQELKTFLEPYVHMAKWLTKKEADNIASALGYGENSP